MSATATHGSLARGLLFQVGFIALVVVWGLPSLLTVVLPYRWRYWFISRWCLLVQGWLRISAGIRHEIHGLEYAAGRPGVVMAKHQSTWETVALVRIFYPQTWVVKRELIKVPVFGWALGLLRPIAIDRDAGRDAMEQVLEQGRTRLDAGRWVVVFPEGTRVPAGYRGRYGSGGAILACAAGFPVIPVAHNAGEHWPRDGLRLRPGVIRMEIGPPIPTRERSPDAVVAEVREWVERRSAALAKGDYSGRPFRREKRNRLKANDKSK